MIVLVRHAANRNHPHPQGSLPARRLAGQGVDRITTNDAPALAQVSGVQTIY
jgi:hypothetical protein